MIVTCSVCSNNFSYTPTKKNPNSVRATCSKKCLYKLVWLKTDRVKFAEKQRVAKTGSKNPQWKGDAVGYMSLHAWVKRHLDKPKSCDICKTQKPLDLANISQEYKRELSDWEWLCRKCHMIKDGRMQVWLSHSKYKKDNPKTCSKCPEKHYAKSLCRKHYYSKKYNTVC